MAGDIGTSFMAPVIQNQEYVQKEQLQPAELAQKYGAARYSNALADRMEAETAADKNVAAQLAQAAGNGPLSGGDGSISGRLNSMSEMYAKAGQPSKAAQLAMQASQAAAHEATARKAQFETAFKQTQLSVKSLDVATKLLGGVTDQDSWQTANQLFEQQTGQKSPFADMPYDPKMVKLLQDSATSSYQKQMVALRGKALQTTAQNVQSEIRHRDAMEGIAAEKLRLSKQREARLTKAGGKDVGAPGKAEVEAAGRLLGDTGLEGDDKDAAAFSIASDAKALRRKNPGLSADEALRQAKLQAQQEGSFTPGNKGSIFGIGKTAGKYTPPVDLPKSGAMKDLVAGQRYRDGSGNVGEWTGKGWKKVTKEQAKAPKPKPVPAGASDGEDPDGEDDE